MSGDGRPLSGRRILVTRRPEQAAPLRARLESLGAEVVECGAIRILPPDDPGPLERALASLHRYHWLLLTSPNAVDAVADRLSTPGELPAGVRVAAVGSATAEAFRRRFPGRDVDVSPASELRAEGLLAALPADVSGLAFLLPASERARDTLPRTLSARGAAVEVVTAYRTLEAPGLAARVAAALARGVDIATFASPSAVESFVAAAPGGARGLAAAVIGPVTGAAATAAGLDVRVVAEPSTAEGLAAALAAYFAAPGPGSLDGPR